MNYWLINVWKNYLNIIYLKKGFLILDDSTMHKSEHNNDEFKIINSIFEFIPGGLIRVLNLLIYL